MPDNQQVSEQELEQLTNQAFGEELSGNRTPETQGSEVEPATQVTQNAPVEPEGQADYSALKPFLDETPYKGDDVVESVKKMVEGYKNIQGQYTKTNERVKRYEQLLQDVEGDPALAQFIEQARTLYRNPQLAQAYQGGGQQDAMPDPRSYDLSTYEGYEKFYSDMNNYQARQLDSRLNARFGQIEAQRMIDGQKNQLKQFFPDANPEDVVEQVQKKAGSWTLTDAYKALDYDNLKSRAMEEARKELTKQLENAGKSGTPSATSQSKGKVSVDDVLGHINRYGSEAARKKYGDKAYYEVLQSSSEFL